MMKKLYKENLHEEIHAGLWISEDGKVYTSTFNPTGMKGYGYGYTNEDPENQFDDLCLYPVEIEQSISGYPFVDEKYMAPNSNSSTITKMDRTETKGKYVHQMVVFSFGDCNGNPYTSIGIRNIIDHLDMNHNNNDYHNLQLVSYGINLWRAYAKTKSKTSAENNCEKRFKDYVKSLDEIDREILMMEIELDMQGKY